MINLNKFVYLVQSTVSSYCISVAFENSYVPNIGIMSLNMGGNVFFLILVIYFFESFPLIVEKIHMMFKWQNQFKCLFDNLEDSVVFFNDDKLEYVNDAFLRTF